MTRLGWALLLVSATVVAFALGCGSALAAPVNDNWASATSISGWNGYLAGSSTSATGQTGEPHGYTKSVWYVWVAPSSGTFTIDAVIAHGSPARVSLYTGTAVNALTQRSTPSTPNTEATTTVTSGTTYYLQVQGISPSSGPFSLSWGVPVNDDYANAMSLVGATGSIFASSKRSTIEGSEPYAHDPSVWFSWMATTDGAEQFSATIDGVDTPLGVYTGSSLASLVEVSGSGPINVRQGTIYSVQLQPMTWFSPGAYQLDWSPAAPAGLSGGISQGFDARGAGADPTRTRVSVGPVSVDVSSGNVLVAIPGPSFPSPAGALGVSIAWNSLPAQPTPQRPSSDGGGACHAAASPTCHAARDYSTGARSTPGLGDGFSLNLSAGSVPVQLIDDSALAPDPPLSTDPGNPEDDPSSDPALAAAMDHVEVVSGDGSSRFFEHKLGTQEWLPEGMALDAPDAAPNGLVTPGDQTDGARLVKDPSPGSGAPTWTLVDPDGASATFGPVGADGKARVWSVQEQSKSSTAGSSLARLEYTYTASGSGTLFPTTITEEPSGRTLSLVWNTIDPTNCAAAILCITGPDAQTWRYIGNASGGTSGQLVSVSDGTRVILGLGWSASGKISDVRSADDLDAANASPGYDSSHEINVTYDASLVGQATSVSDENVSDAGSPVTHTWQFNYWTLDGTDSASFGSGQFVGTNVAHPSSYQGGALAAGTHRLGEFMWTQVTLDSGPFWWYITGTGGRLMLRYDDSGGGVEQFENAPDGRLLWREDQNAQPTDYTYDGTTGQLLTVQQPDPDGAGPLTRPTTTSRYDEATIGTATTPGTPQTGLKAEWYANQTLSGIPITTTWSKTSGGILDENWTTTGPPALGSPSSDWSARFSGTITTPTTGDYHFQLSVDDGASVYIDDQPVAGDWTSGSLRTVTGDRAYLTAGQHRIVVEYFQAASASELHLSWKKPGDPSYSLVPYAQVAPGYGLQTSTVSPAGQVSFSHYADPASGQPDYTESGGALRLVNSFTYDALGRILTRVQPKGNTSRTIASDGTLGGSPDTTYETDYAYYADTATAAPPAACPSGSAVNQAGQLETTSRSGYADQTSVYDVAGRTITSTNGKGTTCSTYDAEGRLLAQRVPGDSTITGCTADSSATACYSYDPSGLQRSAQTANGSVLLSYDEDGRVIGSTQKDASGSVFGESSISHNATGDPYQTIVAPGPLASTLSYTWQTHYSPEHLLTDEEIVDPFGGAQEQGSFGYDAAHRLISVTSTDVASGVFTFLTYDNDGNITHTYNRHGTACGAPCSVPTDAHPYADFAYTNDADGRITSQTRTGQSLTSATTAYTYDAASRLATATLPSGLVRTYHYDDDTNRTSIDEQPSGGSLTTVATYAYSTTAQDRLSTITTSAGTTTYGYSSDGDTTSYGTNTLTWNGHGKIATDAPTSSSSVAYTNDPLGRLQTRTTTGPTATNNYIYAGTSDTPIMVTDGSGTITESYIGGPLGTRRMIAGPPLDADGGGPSATSTFLMPDGLGNQAATLNDTGTRTNTYTYDAFGTPNEATPTNTLTNRFLAKNGRPLDTLSGLVLMGARAYDAATGRFLSVDPVERGSATIFDYVNQNPLNATDPDGTNGGPICASGKPACKKYLKHLFPQCKGCGIKLNEDTLDALKDFALETGGGALLGAVAGCVTGAAYGWEGAAPGLVGGCAAGGSFGAVLGAKKGFNDVFEGMFGPGTGLPEGG